jgi:hypothetical protein
MGGILGSQMGIAITILVFLATRYPSFQVAVCGRKDPMNTEFDIVLLMFWDVCGWCE